MTEFDYSFDDSDDQAVFLHVHGRKYRMSEVHEVTVTMKLSTAKEKYMHLEDVELAVKHPSGNDGKPVKIDGVWRDYTPCHEKDKDGNEIISFSLTDWEDVETEDSLEDDLHLEQQGIDPNDVIEVGPPSG